MKDETGNIKNDEHKIQIEKKSSADITQEHTIAKQSKSKQQTLNR